MDFLKVIEHEQRRVLTTKQIAEAYGTDHRVISKNFNRNKERYIEGKHYICLEGENKREFLNHRQIGDGSKNANKLYLWTEKGAFLHAKSLGTDKAWEVYERLVDFYFTKQKQQLTLPEQIKLIAQGNLDHEKRIMNLENNMTIDYGQSQFLGEVVNKAVIETLGGKNSEAYKQIGKKVFAECNRDLKNYFCVNSRNNVPAVKYEEAITYARNWKPCTNTLMSIKRINGGGVDVQNR